MSHASAGARKKLMPDVREFQCTRFQHAGAFWFAYVDLFVDGRLIHSLPVYVGRNLAGLAPVNRQAAQNVSGAVFATMGKVNQGYMATTRGLPAGGRPFNEPGDSISRAGKL